MRLSTTRLFPLALMFVLALLTFYLERTVRQEESPPARQSTESLHVLPDRALARTDRLVMLEDDQRWLAGRGMEYDWGSGRLQLHHDVRGRFNAKAP